MTTYIDHLATPLGPMEIEASNTDVISIYFVDAVRQQNPNQITDQAKTQLHEYFDGKREVFELPLGARGTEFQQQVWRALTAVEYGKTCSYSDIAQKIAKPKAVRAVGAANGKNPLTIVVPCHRVIGANGSLTGYASGTERKAWLLNHESNTLF